MQGPNPDGSRALWYLNIPEEQMKFISLKKVTISD
jgi:hypothetical protein